MDSRCNICGVPENRWEDGFCHECRHSCEMTPDVLSVSEPFNMQTNMGSWILLQYSIQGPSGKSWNASAARKKSQSTYAKPRPVMDSVSPLCRSSPVDNYTGYAGTAWMGPFW